MADQALAPASAGTVDGAPSFQDTSSSLETPSQLLSVVSGGMPPNLLSAKLLDVVLPSSKNGISPLRVRRRGVRRLLYQDEPVEQEDQSGDLGEHSLANDYIRHSSSKVAQPDLSLQSTYRSDLYHCVASEKTLPFPHQTSSTLSPAFSRLPLAVHLEARNPRTASWVWVSWAMDRLSLVSESSHQPLKMIPTRFRKMDLLEISSLSE